MNKEEDQYLELNEDLAKECEHLLNKSFNEIFSSHEMKQFAFSKRILMALLFENGGSLLEKNMRELFQAKYVELIDKQN